MNKNDWYNTESWYAPIQQEPERSASAAPIKKKKKAWKSWHILAIVGLVALLIVGGAVGYTGAPYLTAAAAVRSGTGLGYPARFALPS